MAIIIAIIAIIIAIVMAIMAVLMLAASPNYRTNMQNLQHQQAELTLHDAQLRLASWLLQHGSYSGASLATLAIRPPADYQLKLSTTEDSYELVATNSSGKDRIIKRV